MLLGRFAAATLVVFASLSLSGCVFDLWSSDEPKPKQRASEECPERDAANWAKMQGFLDANKQKPGVKVMDGGVQYIVLSAGSEKARKPTWASIVQVRYRGTLIDGSVFDETKPNEPAAEFEAGGVIKGWQQALVEMREGDKWNIVVPSDLAYGCKGRGEIKPDQVLVFDIELLKVK